MHGQGRLYFNRASDSQLPDYQTCLHFGLNERSRDLAQDHCCGHYHRNSDPCDDKPLDVRAEGQGLRAARSVGRNRGHGHLWKSGE